MDLNQTVYIPYCGQRPDDLRPYWAGVQKYKSLAAAEAARIQALLSDEFGEVSFWDTRSHQAGDVPIEFAAILQRVLDVEVEP